MPIYRHFYVEHLGKDGWNKPVTLVHDESMFDPELGQFAWVHPREGWLDLFFGDDALFPFHIGCPNDWGNSPLLHYLKDVHEYDFDRNDDTVAWIPFSELFVDEWENETLLVGYRVESKWVSYFGDGNSPFPHDLMNKTDFKVDMCFRERARRWSGEPICGIYGAARNRLSKLPPDAGFNVTCRETVAEYIGNHYAPLFAGIREHGRDEDLRILSVRG